MKKFIVLGFLLFQSAFAAAEQSADWSIRPHVSIGYNKAQKSYYSFGLNASSWANDYILWGAGAYYAAGTPSTSTREIGAGPFAAFYMPFTEFLTGEVREEILYMDQRQPLDADRDQYETERGVASVSSIGLHLKLASFFGISGGYRFVVGLSNDKLDDDRSGTYLGVAISF